MREFRQRSNTLTRLSPGAKLLYLSFLLLTLAGFATSLALYYDSLGIAPSDAAAWYLGNEDDPDATEMLLGQSGRQLLEVAHFHLFTMPILLLVLGHLFLLARGGSWKQWVVGAAALSTVAHVAGPAVIWALGPGMGWIMGATGVPFLALYVFMALYPVPDLLTPAARETPR